MIRILLEVFKKYTFQQKRVLLLFIVALAVFGAGIRLFITGDLDAIKKNKMAVALELKRGTTLGQSMSLEAEAKKYAHALSPSKETSWMMEAVHKAASEAGLSVVSVAPQSAEKADVFEKISLMVELSGGYHTIGKFVERIENHEPWIFLNQLRMERCTRAGAARCLNAYLVLSAYYEAPGGAK